MPLIKAKKVRGDDSASLSAHESERTSALIKRDRVSVVTAPPGFSGVRTSPGVAPGTELPLSGGASPEAGSLTSTVQEPPPISPAEQLQAIREQAKKVTEEARDQAQQIIGEAQGKAKKLIEEAKLYSQSVQSTAEREGFAIGREEGARQGYQEVAGLIEEARSTLQQTLRERERVLRSIEPEVARLSIKIAERIIGTQVTMGPEIIMNMVKAALERVKDRDHVILRVNSADVEAARKNKELFARVVEGVRSLEIQPDPRVERGGCIIETDLGTVDARISTQLAALEIAFRDAAVSGSELSSEQLSEEDGEADPHEGRPDEGHHEGGLPGQATGGPVPPPGGGWSGLPGLEKEQDPTLQTGSISITDEDAEWQSELDGESDESPDR